MAKKKEDVKFHVPKGIENYFESAKTYQKETYQKGSFKDIIKKDMRKGKTKFGILIKNIVASASLNVKIPLEKILKSVEGAEYPSKYPGLVYRMKNPKVAASLFSSGKIVLTEATSVADVRKALGKVVKMLRSLQIDVPKKYEMNIENILATAWFPYMSLIPEKIVSELEGFEYEPGQNPDFNPPLYHKMKDPKADIYLFSCGKVLIEHIKKIEDIERAMNILFKKFKSIGAIKKY